MDTPTPLAFPLEKIFGSRTRIKVITLFTTGVKRPYYVREIARIVNERLNAVRRELEILRKVGMLSTREDKHRKYYLLNANFVIAPELASIMQKVGPGIQDVLFKDVERLGDVKYLCLSGYFTGTTQSPTDMLVIGSVSEPRLQQFVDRLEEHLGREVSYTPMTESEYKYRRNFKDLFLRQIFEAPYKEIINKLPPELQPGTSQESKTAVVIQEKTGS
ncbi:MAG: winged helix-turn-helix domain-containing protein [Patescibacteria group bacterium]